MKVAILGCGPAGLLAAHACYISDVEFDIYSKKRKSELFGSQYLHNPIPELTPLSDTGVPVRYITLGSPEEYRRKTHGKWWDGQVAPEEFEPDHTAWDIRQAYDQLWSLYWRKISDYDINKASEEYCTYPDEAVSYDLSQDKDLEIGGKANKYDLIVSTVPRTIWKRNGDEFIFSEGWALGDAPERGVFVEDIVDLGNSGFMSSGSLSGDMPDNHIVCDGTSEVPWTRLSKVYGYTSVEWPHHVPQPHSLATLVTKPLHYAPGTGQLDAPSRNWLHVGRYGEWKKGVVVTDAFDEVYKKIQEMK
jgi:hypothetical protein